MARQGISTGIVPNDGTGDTLASGAVKINQNFSELYSFLGDGNNLNTIKAGNLSLTGITTGLNVPGISTLGFIQNTTLNVSGFSTLGSISGENLSLAGVTTGLNVPGISTLGFITATTLNTSGVSTFSGGLNASEGADLTRLRVTGISTLGQTNTTGFFNAGVSTLGNVNATTAVVSGFSTLGSISGGNLTLAGITTGLNVPGITTLRDTTIGNLSLAGITTGLSSPGISTLGSISATTLVVTGVSTVGVVTGATSVQATNLYGNGSGLTSLDASNLSSGIIPSGRLTGSYDISITGTASSNTISVSTATVANNLVIGPIGSATTYVDIRNGDINVTNNLKVSGIATATTLRVNTLTNIAGTSIPNPISLTTAFVTLTSNITWHTNRNNTTQLLGSIAPYTNSKTKMVRISVIHVHIQPGGYHGYLSGWIFQTGKTYNVNGTYVENEHYNWYWNKFQTEVLIPWDPSGTQSISMFVTSAYNTSSLNYYNIVYTGRIDQ